MSFSDRAAATQATDGHVNKSGSSQKVLLPTFLTLPLVHPLHLRIPLIYNIHAWSQTSFLRCCKHQQSPSRQLIYSAISIPYPPLHHLAGSLALLSTSGIAFRRPAYDRHFRVEDGGRGLVPRCRARLDSIVGG